MKYPSVSENLRQVTNPYLPSWEYVPDGEPYVFGDRVYVYGSHDFFNGDLYCMATMCAGRPRQTIWGSWRYEGVDLPEGSGSCITAICRAIYTRRT